MPIHEWTASPVFGAAVTVIMYSIALAVRERLRWMHPLFLCCAGIVLVLLAFRIPYEDYAVGGDWIAVLLGPATVALAVPLYKHWKLIVSDWLPIAAGIVAGTLVSFLSTIVLVRCFGGSEELLRSALPKSASSPISIEIVRAFGGIPELGAVLTVLTGLFGSMFGTMFLRWIGVRTDLAVGIAMGTAAHGIGTAKVIRDSELRGAYSSLAMGVAGVLVSVLSVFVYRLL
jgi:predicted murein hydrolase (TIGR00659 family)